MPDGGCLKFDNRNACNLPTIPDQAPYLHGQAEVAGNGVYGDCKSLGCNVKLIGKRLPTHPNAICKWKVEGTMDTHIVTSRAAVQQYATLRATNVVCGLCKCRLAHMQKCTVCGISYCNRECQLLHWVEHSSVCKPHAHKDPQVKFTMVYIP